MRRVLRGFVVAALLFPAPLMAQRVQLEVAASEPGPNGVRRPIVRTPGILRDQRWLESLQSSFPLRLQFRVEIWRVRTDWFDALERSFEWEVLVQYAPLTDEYTKSEAWGGALRRQNRFSTLQELELDLERGNQIGIAPAAAGEYYFTSTLRIRTLSDEEMEDLERFLQGNPTLEERERGSVLSRAARRMLLRFGGLPFEELEARSVRFVVGPGN